MAAGVLLDTSFLITLGDRSRAHHDAARRYWRHFMDEAIPVYLPTVVVSEFCLRQEIPPEILRCCVICPFNWNDALHAAKLDWTRHRSADADRQALKDDIKIIAQAAELDSEFVITDDTNTFFRYCKTLKENGEVRFSAISLEAGFDRSFFDPNGQKDFTDQLGPDEAGS